MKRFFLSLLLMSCCNLMGFAAIDYTQIYLIGAAAPNGWEVNKAQILEPVSGSDAVFAWTGYLKTGDFKFLNALGSWDNCFHASTADESVELGKEHALVYNNPAGDFKFTIEQGYYTVKVDLRSMTMIVNNADNILPKELWITGSAVPDGTQKLLNYPNRFKYFGELKEGEVKIMTTPTVTSSTQYLVPILENTDVVNSGSDIKYTNDPNAMGWKVLSGNPQYKITFDFYSKNLKGELYTPWSGVFIIGECVESGWSLEKAPAFSMDAHDPNTFSWTGYLKIGDNADSNMFKLLGQRDWNPNNAHPYVHGANILSDKYMVFNGNDDKWSINENGYYSIKVNLFYETIEASYSSTSEVNNSHINYLTVYSDNCSIVIDSCEPAYVEVIDYNGKIVATKSLSSGVVVSNLPSGLYIVKTIIKDCKSVKKLIVK